MNSPLPILFPIGQLVATPNALSQVSTQEISEALLRHMSGDWGECCEEDKQTNNEALRNGERILSVYKNAAGEKWWLITEADRSVTTALMPEDY